MNLRTGCKEMQILGKVKQLPYLYFNYLSFPVECHFNVCVVLHAFNVFFGV